MNPAGVLHPGARRGIPMAQRLVTIATFDQPAKARLAQNALHAEGVRAEVNDESLVAMDWLLSNAVGGVKVQVREEDAERAVAVLERAFGANGEQLGPAARPDPHELAAEAEAAEREPEDEPEPDQPTDPGPDSHEPPAPGSREDYARRMVFAAMLGLLFAPLGIYTGRVALSFALISFYALYLLLNAAFGEGELSGRGWFNLVLGGLMTLAGLAWFLIIGLSAAS
jgi:hypothetical protein